MSKIYAVDFDDTLFKADYEKYPYPGEPNLPLIEKLKKLKEEGNEIILWTCRRDKALDVAVACCGCYGLTFTAVNESSQQSLAKHPDRRKIYADYYIDDKGITAEDFVAKA